MERSRADVCEFLKNEKYETLFQDMGNGNILIPCNLPMDHVVLEFHSAVDGMGFDTEIVTLIGPA